MATEFNLYQILVGVGKLYVADVGTDFPEVDEEPSADWTYMGETVDGVKLKIDQKVATFTTDQRTTNVKANRTEETATISTKLAQATFENMAQVMGTTVTTTPGSSGVPATKKVGLTRGTNVQEFALLFRGDSPYGPYSAQYEVPRGYFSGSQEFEHAKGKQVVIPFEFEALADLDAVDESEQFGRLVAQTAAVTTT